MKPLFDIRLPSHRLEGGPPPVIKRKPVIPENWYCMPRLHRRRIKKSKGELVVVNRDIEQESS